MELRIANFEKLTSNYKTYVDGYGVMVKKRNDFINETKASRDEFKAIVEGKKMPLIQGNETMEEARNRRIYELGNELKSRQEDYTHDIKKMEGDLNEKVYDELELLMKEFAEKNNIDVITSKSDIIYNSDKYDITKDIIEVFKERDLFSDIKDMKNKLTDDIEL